MGDAGAKWVYVTYDVSNNVYFYVTYICHNTSTYLHHMHSPHTVVTYIHDDEKDESDIDVREGVPPVRQDKLILQVLRLPCCPCDVAEQVIDGLLVRQLAGGEHRWTGKYTRACKTGGYIFLCMFVFLNPTYRRKHKTRYTHTCMHVYTCTCMHTCTCTCAHTHTHTHTHTLWQQAHTWIATFFILSFNIQSIASKAGLQFNFFLDENKYTTWRFQTISFTITLQLPHVGSNNTNCAVSSCNFWLLNLSALCKVHLMGPAQTVLCAATLRPKLQTQLAISPNHSIQTLCQPVLVVAQYCQEAGRAVTWVPICESLEGLNQRQWGLIPKSLAHEEDTLPLGPHRHIHMKCLGLLFSNQTTAQL